MRRGAAAGLAALVTLLAGVAHAGDAAEFEYARTRYETGKLEGDDGAAARLATLLDPSMPPCEPAGPARGCRLTEKLFIERARALYAATLVALKREREADAQLEAILRENPGYQPSLELPQEVIDRVTATRERLRPELDKILRDRQAALQARLKAQQKARDDYDKWLKDIQGLAAEEKVIERRPRWLAFIPFGVGQFVNDDIGWGIFFLASEVLSGAASIVTAQIISNKEENAFELLQERQSLPPGERPDAPDLTELDEQLSALALANQVSFAAWGVLTVVGIVHAQITFDPEVERSRKRKLPPRPPLPTAAPVVVGAPGGGFVGVRGTF